MAELTVIIATLMRPSLQQTVKSVKESNVEVNLLTRYDPKVNEYVSRDRAVKDAKTKYIAFVDDDAYYEPGALRNALKHLEEHKFVEGMVQGNLWGKGFVQFRQSHLGIGTAQFMWKEAYEDLGGFRLDWGRSPHSGWRMDTSLLYDFLKRYGEDEYLYADDVLVTHPNSMQSQWSPRIEWLFWRTYEEYVRKYVLPIDGRLPALIRHSDLMDDAVKYIPQGMDEIIFNYHKGIVTDEAFDALKKTIEKVKK